MLLHSPHSASLSFKVCICGQQGVGKTALVNRRITGEFLGDYRPTIAATFVTVTESVRGKTVILNVWDTAGQERYQSMMPMYFRNVACVILVVDVSDPGSWGFIKRWTDNELVSLAPQPMLVLCLNKSDLEPAADISGVADWAAQLGCPIYHTSAMTGANVNEVFRKVATGLIDEYSNRQMPQQIPLSGATPRKGCC